MYSYLLPTVLVLLIGTGIQIPWPAAEGAPVTFAESSSSDSQYQRSALHKILNDAIFNSTDNFYIIKRAFQVEQGVHKICIPVTYNVTCTNQSVVYYDHDLNCIFNCTTGYNVTIIWTEFDTKNIAGKAILHYASDGFSVFGFDWTGACDVVSSVVTLKLTVMASILQDLCNDTDQMDPDLLQALQYITTLVRL